MSSSDFNMLRLEAPRDVLQITDGTASAEQAVEVANPAVWVRTLVRQQKQAEEDMRELVVICGNTIDRTDQRIQRIESAYQTLAQGTRYVYDRVNAYQEIEETWVRSELAAAANAYQTFTRNVWQAIIEKTNEATERQVCQATQLTRVNDALAFLGEANTARNQHLAQFQGNVETWAAEHQRRQSEHQRQIADLGEQLRRANEEIQRVAGRIPLPPPTRSPTPPPLPPSSPQPWRSPPRPTTTSQARTPSRPPAPIAAPSTTPDLRQRLAQFTTAPTPPKAPLRSPFVPTTRRIRPPAVPATSPRPYGPITGTAGGPPSEPPSSPPAGAPTPPPPRSPRRPRRSATPPPNPQPLLTTHDLIQLVARGVREADQAERGTGRYMEPQVQRVAPLKLPKPDTYDGKPKTPFRQWWKTLEHYFRFYPGTLDEQKIAFVGALLTDEAKEWHQSRDDMIASRRGQDTWPAYSEAIQAEYTDPREGATAHAKLKTLKYKNDIKAYLTSFKTLNLQAGSTGEGLQDIINEALPNEIIDVRFYQNPRPLRTDEDFITATYEAGRHVEELQALKARKAAKTPATTTKAPTGTTGSGRTERKDDKQGNQKTDSRPREGDPGRTARNTWFGKKDTWPSQDDAMKGVPTAEKEEYRLDRDGCWRCGRGGHKTYECLAFNTRKGTKLPPAPWKVGAVTEGGKRKREDEPEATPASKQQKVATAETMEIDAMPIWESDEEDF